MAGIAPATTAAGGADSADAPVVIVEGGPVRGVTVGDAQIYRGLPYAAPPTGQLRWRPPQAPAAWTGVRDASDFAPNCPQPETPFTAGPQAEDCLYLNVTAPRTSPGHAGDRPVIVWIHGGGLTLSAGRDFDAAKLAAAGSVVVTVNYRLGALGFLAHPALESSRGSAGNYGLMDQQAALRWVQRNIGRFGGDPSNVTIAGQSAGGLSVLAHVVSRSSTGLFQRAIVSSGTFALTQQSLAAAEAGGKELASRAGCADQSARCLRALPVKSLLDATQGFEIPGVVDGAVLKESIGTSLAAGRFTQVPIMNGENHDEQRGFMPNGAVVSGGRFVPLPQGGVTADNYQSAIASVLDVPADRAAAIATEYPLGSYPSPDWAFSALTTDSEFACTALRTNEWTALRMPTFAYEFNDDAAPPRYPPQLDPPVATHGSELPYIFDLPSATYQDPLSPDQEPLADAMREAWVNFAATGNPSTSDVRWPAYRPGGRGLSLVAPTPQTDTSFAARHHCSFWAAG
ncbi:carboxylesterase/lipase family protein [Streptomyces sp. NPDC001292]|uniref:carboxylesterase/lipase family protein n=1 Tax=Streptomyces sp. NPDC001292 TaxID=3364558 RepID=UPI00367ECAD3